MRSLHAVSASKGTPSVVASIVAARSSAYSPARRAGEYAEDLAATMLATTLGIAFEAETAWSERIRAFRMEGQILRTRHVVQSAEGDAHGRWTTVVAAGVFVL